MLAKYPVHKSIIKNHKLTMVETHTFMGFSGALDEQRFFCRTKICNRYIHDDANIDLNRHKKPGTQSKLLLTKHLKKLQT